jgi:hypothetical protein
VNAAGLEIRRRAFAGGSYRAAVESGVGSRRAPKHRKRMLPRMAELVPEHAGENSIDSTTICVHTG